MQHSQLRVAQGTGLVSVAGAPAISLYQEKSVFLTFAFGTTYAHKTQVRRLWTPEEERILIIGLKDCTGKYQIA